MNTDNTIASIIKTVMKETRTTQLMLAERCGIKQGALSQRLSYKSPSIDNVVEMLDAMGYELVVKPKKRGKRAEDEFVVARSADEGSESK